MVLRNAQCSRPARNTGRRRPLGSAVVLGVLSGPLLAVGLGLLSALAALARGTVGLTGVALTVGLAGVGGLLATLLGSLLLLLLLATLLRNLLLLLATLLGSLLLRGLLLTTLLRNLLLLLLRGLLQSASERIVGGLKAGIRLGQPDLGLIGVARGHVTLKRAVELLQLTDHDLPLLPLLRELLVPARQDKRPQVGERFRLAGLEAQSLLDRLHDLCIGDGQSVGLANFNQHGRPKEAVNDLRPIHTLTHQVLPTERGVQLLDHDVDVLLTDDHGVVGPVQAGVVHVGRLTGVVGAAGERPDGEEECGAGGEDARACGKASGHGLLLEGDAAGGRHGVTTFLPRPYRSARDDARSRSAAH